LLRFGVVGVATFALNMFCVWVFYGVAKIEYRISVSLAYMITVMTHFGLNRSFTYKVSGGGVFSDTFRYVIVLFINYLITLGVVSAVVEFMKVSVYYGVIASTFATASSSFFLMKHFVFARKEVS
jgi:putative flippase GtrA